MILLLSDGASTTGDYDARARRRSSRRRAGVPVYTVALGTENGTIEGPDGFGGVRTIRVPPDPETLKAVAETTGGKFFAAADANALKSVYDQIGSQVGVDHKTRELTVLFTAAGRRCCCSPARASRCSGSPGCPNGNGVALRLPTREPQPRRALRLAMLTFEK